VPTPLTNLGYRGLSGNDFLEILDIHHSGSTKVHFLGTNGTLAGGVKLLILLISQGLRDNPSLGTIKINNLAKKHCRLINRRVRAVFRINVGSANAARCVTAVGTTACRYAA